MADLSSHPFAREGETKITQPVVIRMSIYWLQTGAGAIGGYDDKTSMATVTLLLRCTWVDPRLAGRSEDEALVKNRPKPDSAAAIPTAVPHNNCPQ